jgi:hypothetical protein
VSLPTEVTITAVPHGGTAALGATLTVVPPALAKLDCGSNTITAGTTATCTVSLNGLVAAGPAAIEPMVSLTSSNPSLGAVPAQVGVKQGEKIASFALKATPIAQSAPLVVSASYGGVTKRFDLTLVPAPLQSLRLSSVAGWGWPIRVDIYLTAPAPEGGMVIQLTSDRPQLTDLPQLPPLAVKGVSIPAGRRSITFDVPTRPAPLGTAVTIRASAPGGQALAAVHQPGTHPIRSFVVLQGGDSHPELVPGVRALGRVTLQRGAPPGGIEVRLTTSDPAVVPVPHAVRIWEGSRDKSFDILPKAVGPRDHPVFFLAEVPGSENVVRVETVIKGSVLEFLHFNASSTGPIFPYSYPSLPVVDSVPFGGLTVTATVGIRQPGAPAGGAAVSLRYAGGTDITGPAVVTVASGEREKSFQVKVSPCSVNPPCTVTITATYGDSTKIASLVVKP